MKQIGEYGKARLLNQPTRAQYFCRSHSFFPLMVSTRHMKLHQKDLEELLVLQFQFHCSIVFQTHSCWTSLLLCWLQSNYRYLNSNQAANKLTSKNGVEWNCPGHLPGKQAVPRLSTFLSFVFPFALVCLFFLFVSIYLFYTYIYCSVQHNTTWSAFF